MCRKGRCRCREGRCGCHGVRCKHAASRCRCHGGAGCAPEAAAGAPGAPASEERPSKSDQRTGRNVSTAAGVSAATAGDLAGSADERGTTPGGCHGVRCTSPANAHGRGETSGVRPRTRGVRGATRRKRAPTLYPFAAMPEEGGGTSGEVSGRRSARAGGGCSLAAASGCLAVSRSPGAPCRCAGAVHAGAGAGSLAALAAVRCSLAATSGADAMTSCTVAPPPAALATTSVGVDGVRRMSPAASGASAASPGACAAVRGAGAAVRGAGATTLGACAARLGVCVRGLCALAGGALREDPACRAGCGGTDRTRRVRQQGDRRGGRLVQKPLVDKRPMCLTLKNMPLKATDARAYNRRPLDNGIFVVSDHARREMNKDDLNDSDAIHILRAAVVREPEWENGHGATAWKRLACASWSRSIPSPTPCPTRTMT